MGAKLSLRGHTFEVRVGRFGLTERLYYDDREVSNRSPFQDRIHIFWVMEGSNTVRYMVMTGDHRDGTIRTIVRNGRAIYLGDEPSEGRADGEPPQAEE